MLIRHSQDIIVHQLARIEAGSLEASQALVAKYRGEQMIAEAVARLEAPAEMSPDETERAVDKVA